VDSYQSPYAEAVGDPGEIIRPLIRKVALQSAAISSGLSALPGMYGSLAVFPEIYLLIRLQSRMVKDIATLLGKESYLSKELIFYCLFKENHIRFFETSFRMIGTRLMVRPVSLNFLQAIFYSSIAMKGEKAFPKSKKGLYSLVSIFVGGAMTYIDTQMVGTTANAIFLGDIEFQSPEYIQSEIIN
jgi:hypothetical protein